MKICEKNVHRTYKVVLNKERKKRQKETDLKMKISYRVYIRAELKQKS